MIPIFNLKEIKERLSTAALYRMTSRGAQRIAPVPFSVENDFAEPQLEETKREREGFYLPYHNPSLYFRDNNEVGMSLMDSLSIALAKLRALGFTAEPEYLSGDKNPTLFFLLEQKLRSRRTNKNPIDDREFFMENQLIKKTLGMFPVVYIEGEVPPGGWSASRDIQDRGADIMASLVDLINTNKAFLGLGLKAEKD